MHGKPWALIDWIRGGEWALTALLCLVCVAGPSPPAWAGVDAELVFRNARIYTVDAENPWATAVAVRDGRIVAVGNEDDVLGWSGDSTRVLDLKGKLLLPAFGDGHVHPVYGGLGYSRCSLHSGVTVEDYLATIRACVAASEGRDWVYGVGWKPGLFPPDGIPPKDLLDEISAERPLAFRSIGGHSLWVNSRGLEAAGIARDTPDPENGRIDRDPVTGELLGGLQESAMDLVFRLLPEPSASEMEAAIEYTVGHLNQYGITNFLDAGVDVDPNGDSGTIAAYQAIDRRGELNAHVSIAVKWDGESGLEQIPALMSAARSVDGGGLTARTLKIWLDGVMAQRTAALLEPYSDAPDEYGAPMLGATRLNRIVTTFDAEGFDIMIHAIGDRAIRMSLDAFEAARTENGPSGNRFQITHTELVKPQDIERFGQLDVMANFQPSWAHLHDYMQMTAVRLGVKRMQVIYPANSVLQAGARVVYGSDWPVDSADPLLGIEVALTRKAPGEPDATPLSPAEAVTLEQAIEAYTLAVAYANHNEEVTGSIEVGKSADMVILDRDLFALPADQIAKASVLLTLFAGRVVYGSLAEL